MKYFTWMWTVLWLVCTGYSDADTEVL